tara:strand:- start:2757 stop:3059 length:303 start_codon:yes stop_codon:yes gene_type:complete
MSTRLEYITQKRRETKKFYSTIKYPNIPLSYNDLYVSTVIGDRLDLLAHQYYGDVDLWWVISIANPDIIRRDSLFLGEGLEIRIPSNIQQIILDFEQLNK